MTRAFTRALPWIAAAWLLPAAARAQTEAGRLIVLARQQIEDLEADSAYRLLLRALDPGTQATESDRVRSQLLLGITHLLRDSNNRLAARQSFEAALRLDPSQRMDSLAYLQSDALAVFNEALSAVAPAPARRLLEVTVAVAADTTVPVENGRLRIASQPSYRARVITSVAPADAPAQVFWADTGGAGSVRTVGWNLRLPGGSLVSPGRYALSVRAVDSLGQVSPTIERVLVVSRAPPDTQPLPGPLDPAALEPETLRTRRSPAALGVGLALGAAAVLLPGALGNGALNAGQGGDGTAYAVGAVAWFAGVIGFLKGERVRVFRESVLRNQEVREEHARRSRAVAESNARAIEAAPVRVRLENP
jgi:hypothetical protein